MYALQNDNYKNYAIQNDGVGPGPTDSRIHASTHDDTLSRRAWRIEFVSAGQFVYVDCDIYRLVGDSKNLRQDMRL